MSYYQDEFIHFDTFTRNHFIRGVLLIGFLICQKEYRYSIWRLDMHGIACNCCIARIPQPIPHTSLVVILSQDVAAHLLSHIFYGGGMGWDRTTDCINWDLLGVTSLMRRRYTFRAPFVEGGPFNSFLLPLSLSLSLSTSNECIRHSARLVLQFLCKMAPFS